MKRGRKDKHLLSNYIPLRRVQSNQKDGPLHGFFHQLLPMVITRVQRVLFFVSGSTSRSSSNGARTAAITVSVISIVIIVVVVLFFLKRYGYFGKRYNLGFDNRSFYYDKSVDYIETQNKD